MTTREYKGLALRNRSRRRDGWFVTVGPRTRWGTLTEIMADVDHYCLYGRLPEQKHLWA